MKPMELSEPPPDDVKNWKSDAPVIATPAARKALAREKPWILMGGSPAALKPPWANAPGVPPPSSARSATAERGCGAPPAHARPRAATLDGSSVGALPETLSKLVAAMAGLPDDKYRYKQLLFWAAEAPDLAAGDKVDANKVPGCLSTVHATARSTATAASSSRATATPSSPGPRFPHQVAGDAPVTTLDVIVYSFVMVAMSGLGGLPFFLLPGGLSKRSAGLANALAAGVMLSASYTMIYEGQVAGPRPPWSGLFLGAAFMRCSRLFIEGREDVTLLGWSGQTTPKGTLLFLAIMAIHSIGEGAGVGVAFARSTGEPSGFRRGGLVAVAIGAHNVPEGFGVALALITKGASPVRPAGPFHAGAAARRAVPAFLFCETFSAIQPLAMGFGAGAMIVVVFGEMLPRPWRTRTRTPWAQATVLSLATFEGFRMMLDWALDAAVRNMDVAGFVEARSDLEAGERTPPPASATRRRAARSDAAPLHNAPRV
ncbi:zinc ion transmembrane transporter [Aureococcus anophagefferens]|nr:zinc ion transmembrane transporter [Aureococcus anophagefferens]